YDRKKDKVYQTEGISINNPRRIKDIIKLIKRLNDNENINYIGLDYIRPAGGGLELVDDFISSMNIDLPGGWDNYTKKERMSWLGRVVTRSKDRDIPIINKWNWWRAHRVSKIIKQIRREVKLKKPLWLFVLSWELGHQHGQDPIMFQDAGADLIAVMMYQANAVQFNYFVNKWKEYVQGRKINILSGNQFDWPLHQYSVMPSGPEEYQRRLIESIECLEPTGNFKGIFIHDFSRALWGRRGPYSTKEWLMAAAEGFSRLDSEKNKLKVSLILPPSAESGKFIEGQIRIKNRSDDEILNLRLSLEAADELGLPFKEKEIKSIKPGAEFIENFKVGVEGLAGQHLGRYMVAARVREDEQIYTATDYLWIKNIDPDRYIKFR
ncbi:MAG: hypothetical protein U9R36_04375, partial [Elusimicrobiota bacterium]|nr:hypothetical protein [Elusimicrobiota bacterium]